MYRLALIFAIAASVGLTAAQHKVCAGCIEEHDINDPELMEGLKAAISSVNAKDEPKQITHAWSQVVAGAKYIVCFNTQDNKECQASWMSVPWVSKEPQDVEYNCNCECQSPVDFWV